MPTYEMSPGNLETALQKSITSTDPPGDIEIPDTDPKVDWVPSYSIDPDYAGKIDEWARAFVTGQANTFEFNLDTTKTQQFKWENYGHKDLSGSAGVSYFGLFRIGAQHGQSESWSRLTDETSTLETKVKIYWQGIRLFSMNPGSWYAATLVH
jgi:hypothetical protein